MEVVVVVEEELESTLSRDILESGTNAGRLEQSMGGKQSMRIVTNQQNHPNFGRNFPSP